MKKITLYQRSKTGKIQEWSIEVVVDNDVAIIKSYSGYVGMKISTNSTIINKGCNIGKKNEKSHINWQ